MKCPVIGIRGDMFQSYLSMISNRFSSRYVSAGDSFQARSSPRLHCKKRLVISKLSLPGII
jgi:hypothetical protein